MSGIEGEEGAEVHWSEDFLQPAARRRHRSAKVQVCAARELKIDLQLFSIARGVLQKNGREGKKTGGDLGGI